MPQNLQHSHELGSRPDPGSAPAARPRKHLMVPGHPRPQARYSSSVTQVQKWVLSSLALVTFGHLCVGLVVAALLAPSNRVASLVGLLVISGLLGVVAVVAVLLIHKKSLATPWLLMGFLPTAVGAYLAWRR